MKATRAIQTTALVPVESAPVEVLGMGDPEWDFARKLRDEAKQAFLRNIDAQVMLGGELLERKTRLGFTARGGDRKSNVQAGRLIAAPRTWDQWCQAELGLSRQSADRFISCHKLIQSRAKALGDDSTACRLLGTPASQLADADYKILSEVLRQLIGEQSQTEMLRDFNLLRRPQPTTGGDTSAFRQKTIFAEPTPAMASELTVSAFCSLDDACRQISRHRGRKDIEAWFSLLPLVSVADKGVRGLLDFQRDAAKLVAEATSDLEDIKERIDRFVAAKMISADADTKAAKRSRKKMNQPTKR